MWLITHRGEAHPEQLPRPKGHVLLAKESCPPIIQPQPTARTSGKAFTKPLLSTPELPGGHEGLLILDLERARTPWGVPWWLSGK